MHLTTEHTIGFHCEQASLGYLRQKCIFPFSRAHGPEIVTLGDTITLPVWLLDSQLTGSHCHGCSHLPGGGRARSPGSLASGMGLGLIDSRLRLVLCQGSMKTGLGPGAHPIPGWR